MFLDRKQVIIDYGFHQPHFNSNH